MLSSIELGGERFFDISAFVTAGKPLRPATHGLAIHHSAGQTVFADRSGDGTTIDEELAQIQAIEAYHQRQGYGGFGYHAAVADSGNVYVVGRCDEQRAHVARRNHELAGVCLLGDFSAARPSAAQIDGAARWLRAMWAVYGLVPAQGHGDWAAPGWGTACPGDGGRVVIATVIALAEEGAMSDERVRQIAREEAEGAVLRALAHRGDDGSRGGWYREEAAAWQQQHAVEHAALIEATQGIPGREEA